jgi:hypothetical protein
MARRPASSCATQPLISWPSVSGVASWRCVRPILTMPSNSTDFLARVSRRRFTLGNSSRSIFMTAAMCIAVGYVSFDDCDMFTWSFGCTGFLLPMTPPVSSMARFEMTSFTFMLLCVPEPVCQTTSGKWSSSVPAMTSSAACTMRSLVPASSSPSAWLVSAAAFLRMPNARMMSVGIRSSPIRKLSRERCVCAP